MIGEIPASCTKKRWFWQLGRDRRFANRRLVGGGATVFGRDTGDFP
jgi:hypothetical protein